MHLRFCAKFFFLHAVHDHIHLGVKQLQIRTFFSPILSSSLIVLTTSICSMIYEVNLILSSPTQCPDYKQLFIVT